MKKVINIIVVLSIVSLLLAACGSAATPTPTAVNTTSNEVVAEGRVEPIHGTNLSFQARGIVEDVLVKNGDTVKEGDVLARLANAGAAEAQVVLAQNSYDLLLRNESGDRARLWTAYMAAQTARGKAEKKWEDLNLDNIKDDIESRKATVEDRQKDVKDAQEEFDKYKNVDENNSSYKNAKDKLENAQNDLNQAQRDLEENIRKRDEVRAALDAALAVEAEAKHQYEISLDGPNTDQLTIAKANLDAAQDALSNYVLTAPFSGVVADVNVKVGEEVGPETRAVSVADTSSWIVETTDVTELEVVHLKIGQQVSMVPDALSDLTLTGTVTEISDAYTQQGGDILYTVRIHVDNPDTRLRWGMTVEATFPDVGQ
ncbi:MAG: efflux RND transporter periplasmic adaptor subunit [Anaerolineales bacterium]